MWFRGIRVYVSDWDMGVRCDIYVGVIVWSVKAFFVFFLTVKAFHYRTQWLPVALLKSAQVWILMWEMHAPFLVLSVRLKSTLAGFSSRGAAKPHVRRCLFCCCWVCRSGMVTFPLENGSSGPLGLTPGPLCVCIVPPFETLMALVERATEWVGDNRPAPSCYYRVPAFAPSAPWHQNRGRQHSPCPMPE